MDLQQERNALASQLSTLQGTPSGTRLTDILKRQREVEALRQRIAAKDAQLAKSMRSALNVPSALPQYDGSAIGTTRADAPSVAAKRAQELRERAAREQKRMLDDLAAAGQEIARGIEQRDRVFGLYAEAYQQRQLVRPGDRIALNAEGRPDGRVGVERVGMPTVAGGSAFDTALNAGRVAGAKGAEAAAERAQAIFQSFADGMQRTLSGAFAGLFTKGLRSAADFATGLRDLLINAISEVAASKALATLVGGGRGAGALGSLGALFGYKGATSVDGTVPAGAAGAGMSRFGAASLAGLGGLGIGTVLGRQFGSTGGVLGGAASGAALGTIVPGIGNVAGAIIGGLAGAVGGLFGGAARKKAKELEQQAVAAARAQYEADKKAEVDSSAGTYLAPAGFSVNGYRFNAGRSASTITGNTFNIMVPDGTTESQAQSILDAFERLVRAQGQPFGSLPRSAR
jgi:cell division septum initiation protein DivIVA